MKGVREADLPFFLVSLCGEGLLSCPSARATAGWAVDGGRRHRTYLWLVAARPDAARAAIGAPWRASSGGRGLQLLRPNAFRSRLE